MSRMDYFYDMYSALSLLELGSPGHILHSLYGKENLEIQLHCVYGRNSYMVLKDMRVSK